VDLFQLLSFHSRTWQQKHDRGQKELSVRTESLIPDEEFDICHLHINCGSPEPFAPSGIDHFVDGVCSIMLRNLKKVRTKGEGTGSGKQFTEKHAAGILNTWSLLLSSVLRFHSYLLLTKRIGYFFGTATNGLVVIA